LRNTGIIPYNTQKINEKISRKNVSGKKEIGIAPKR